MYYRPAATGSMGSTGDEGACGIFSCGDAQDVIRKEQTTATGAMFLAKVRGRAVVPPASCIPTVGGRNPAPE